MISKFKKIWNIFNPSLKEKMEKNPNISILGFCWACIWRVYVLLILISLGLIVVEFIFEL